MQSSMYNQRSSPTRPFDFTSLRQAASLGLFALHLAFMSFSFCVVSFILDGFASAGAAVVAAGAVVVWAEAVCRLPATSSMAARQTLLRSMEIPLKSHFFDGCAPRDANSRPAIRGD